MALITYCFAYFRGHFTFSEVQNEKSIGKKSIEEHDHLMTKNKEYSTPNKKLQKTKISI